MKSTLLKKQKKLRSVYLDHAAATPIDPLVVQAMKPWLTGHFANPSPLYSTAVEARRALDSARQTIATVLDAQPDTIIFTSSGTESANLAILGVARCYTLKTKKTGHIITTSIEHHAVLAPIEQLEKEGWKVTYLPVDSSGRVSVQDAKNALRKDTVLISIMYANNEIGTIEPIVEIGKELLKWRKTHGTAYPYFHTDACQAAAYLDLSVDRLHVDLLTMNGSKLYGPKGVGILYKRRGTPIEPIIYGGGQEFGLRSGTENVPGIVAMAKAIELVSKYQGKEIQKIEQLRNYFWKNIQEKIPDVMLNGPDIASSSSHKQPHALIRKMKQVRLPNNLSVTFRGVTAESLILYLDAIGIQCSSGSACTTNNDEVSHVLAACGMTVDNIQSTVRFTLGTGTTKKDIDYVMKFLPIIVQNSRRVRDLEQC